MGPGGGRSTPGARMVCMFLLLVISSAETFMSCASLRFAVFSEKGLRLAQKMQVGPRYLVGVQLKKAEVGPNSGPTWRLSVSL